MAPEPESPRPVTELPASYEEAEAPGDHEPLRWWSSFDDPALDAVVDTALAANLDLAEAVARLEEVRAQARAAGAPRFPSVDVNGSVNDTRSPSNAGFGDQFAQLLADILGLDPDSIPGGGGGSDGDGEGDEGGAGSNRIASRTYSASVGVSWEVDFWGRIGNEQAAALREVGASEADLHAARLAVLSETISTWFEIADLRRRVALAEETVEVLDERERLTEDRYDRGLVTSFELYQVRQELRDTQAGLPLLESALTDATSRLAVLLGRYSSGLDGILPDTVDSRLVADPVPAGIPADLLAQRPDVRAAAERYEAARLRVGARKAELFPRLTLSGSVGLESSAVDNFLDLGQWTSNLVAGLTAPIFRGGALRANVSAAQARYARQAALFGRTVLSSVEEVERALVRYREERRRHDFLRSRLDEADASVRLLASRYASGVAGYLDYLDAVRTLLNVRSGLAQSRRDLSLALLGVHRALGGGWTEPDDATADAGATAEGR